MAMTATFMRQPTIYEDAKMGQAHDSSGSSSSSQSSSSSSVSTGPGSSGVFIKIGGFRKPPLLRNMSSSDIGRNRAMSHHVLESSDSKSTTGSCTQPMVVDQGCQKPHLKRSQSDDFAMLQAVRERQQFLHMADQDALASCRDANTASISTLFSNIIARVIRERCLEKLQMFSGDITFQKFMQLPPAYMSVNGSSDTLLKSCFSKKHFATVSKLQTLLRVSDPKMGEVKQFFIGNIPPHSKRPGFLLMEDLQQRTKNIFQSLLMSDEAKQRPGWNFIELMIEEGSLFERLCLQVAIQSFHEAMENNFDGETTWALIEPFKERIKSLNDNEHRSRLLVIVQKLMDERSASLEGGSRLPLNTHEFGMTW
jgi:hypothetical protein